MENATRKIAHDLNNFLNVIIGNIEISIHSVPEPSQIRSNLEEVLMASTRAQKLVQEILESGCQEDNHQLHPIQVSKIAKDIIRLLRASLPKSIELVENIYEETGFVLADPVQIQRIIMNLCTNGYHAMEKTGGKLSVSLTNIDIDPAESSKPDINPGAYVCLSVRDAGHGIKQEIIHRIFDPNFTTKDKGKGNGLGLLIVHEIVKGYGGDIRVFSEPGKGTVVNVYLPRLDSEFHLLRTLIGDAARSGPLMGWGDSLSAAAQKNNAC